MPRPIRATGCALCPDAACACEVTYSVELTDEQEGALWWWIEMMGDRFDC